MDKIINLRQLTKICKQIHSENKSIVLVGGCFDIFHYGHFAFLKAASRKGDHLMILLESDLAVKKYKGSHRPITSQTERAEILSEFPFVGSVILLESLLSDADYTHLVHTIMPATIALTTGDPQLANKTRQAAKVNGKVVVIDHVKTASTTEILKLLSHDL